MADNRFSKADLLRLGLHLQPDGSYAKSKNIFVNTISIEKIPSGGNPYWKHKSLVDVFAWCENNKCIFIVGNVPSSKNSRINFVGKNGKQMSMKSKSCTKYINESSKYYSLFKPQFLKLIDGKQKPYKIELTFIRDNKHKFDYINPAQTVQDIMTEEKWIEDDNMTEIIPYFGLYGYDKKMPGVLIKIL